MQFTDPLDAADGPPPGRSSKPLAEIHQIQGQTPSAASNRMVGRRDRQPADEQCDFEQLAAAARVPGHGCRRRSPTIRRATTWYATPLKDGLAFEQDARREPVQVRLRRPAANNHNAGPPVGTDEGMWGGRRPAVQRRHPRAAPSTDGINVQPGGPWRWRGRKRTRGTRSSRRSKRRRDLRHPAGRRRPVVRFFFRGTLHPKNLCKSPERIRQAYCARGHRWVATSAAAGAVPGGAGGRRNPGTVREPRGRTCSAIQIVKGWVDAQGWAPTRQTFRRRRPTADKTAPAVDPQTSAAAHRYRARASCAPVLATIPTSFPRRRARPSTTAPRCSRTRRVAGTRRLCKEARHRTRSPADCAAQAGECRSRTMRTAACAAARPARRCSPDHPGARPGRRRSGTGRRAVRRLEGRNSASVSRGRATSRLDLRPGGGGAAGRRWIQRPRRASSCRVSDDDPIVRPAASPPPDWKARGPPVTGSIAARGRGSCFARVSDRRGQGRPC